MSIGIEGGNNMLLLQPFRLGDLELRNRMAMAPLTRTRATLPGGIPNHLMLEYYAQRATAGLIITEGTFVSDQARGWFGAPGVYTEAQRKGWQNITDAVHRGGGRIMVQLWHQGSVSIPQLVGVGRTPMGPSAVNPEQLVHIGYAETELSGVPAEMTLDDIRQTISDFRHAAKVALDAGFDGVQIQGGYVYLFQQFLQENLNRRADLYGGSMENRARLLFEVLEAVLEIWPGQRVGMKAGPMMPEGGGFRSLPSTLPTAEHVYRRLSGYSLSHVMLMRQQADLSGTPLQHLQGDAVVHHFRRFYSGNLILNVDIARAHGEQLLQQGLGEMIAFGRDYIANPDLVERIRAGGPLNSPRPQLYYGPTAEGYTDYPKLTQRQPEVTTSRVLDALPPGDLSYTPHPRSSSAATVAWTIVRGLRVCRELLKMPRTAVSQESNPDLATLVSGFRSALESVAAGVLHLPQRDWTRERTVTSNGAVILRQPLGQILWLFHCAAIHHRGQLSTYLRPMGSEVPSIYGPSGDELVLTRIKEKL